MVFYDQNLNLTIPQDRLYLTATFPNDIENGDFKLIFMPSGGDVDMSIYLSNNPQPDTDANPAIIWGGGFYQLAAVSVKDDVLVARVLNTPPAQYVFTPANNFEAANIQLDASRSSRDVLVDSIQVLVSTEDMFSPNYLSKISIFDDRNEIALSNNPDSDLSGGYDEDVIVNFIFASPLELPRGSVKTLRINTDIHAMSISGWFKIGISQDCTVSAHDLAGNNVDVVYEYNDGQQMSIVNNGRLTFSRVDTLQDQYITGDTVGVEIGAFNVRADYTFVDIEQMWLDIEPYQGGGTDELASIYLYSGRDQIVEAIITSSNQGAVLFDMKNNPLRILADQIKNFRIIVDSISIRPDGVGTTARATEGFKPILRVNDSKIIAKTYGRIARLTPGDLVFPNFVLVKSKPTIIVSATGDGPISGNGDYELIDIKVSADSKGPIGLYKMTFKVRPNSIVPSYFELTEDGTVVSIENSNPKVGLYKESATGDYEIWEAYFNRNSIGGELRTIPAGAERTYTLKASLAGYSGDSSTISTSIFGDVVAAEVGGVYYLNADQVDSVADDDFIWSDLSWGNTSTTASQTQQFINGYRLGSSGGFQSTESIPVSI